MADFVMPSLGAGMETGTLVEWKKQPGERVVRGDIIAVVETDKGAIDVEVFVTGVVERLLVDPGTKVPVGTPLAAIQEEGAPAAPPAVAAPPAAPVAAPAVAAPPTSPAAPPPVTGPPAAPAAPPRASPMARRRARELEVALESIRGTGPHGAITVEDVEKAAAQRPAAPAEAPADRMRRAIGAAVSLSKREIPHYYLSHTVDLGPALASLAELNRGRGVAERIVPAALLLLAAARALREVPELNAFWTGQSAPPLPNVHLGVAIGLRGGGLVAPAIHDADRKDLPALMAGLRDLTLRARSGRLRSSELADGTITVTCLGERGAEAAFPVIFPPQVAMVGFGRIVERPWVVAGALVPRPAVTVSLAADHRVTNGHRGCVYLAAIEELLAEPARLT